MRLRTAILGGMLLVVFGSVAVITVAVQRVVYVSARRAVGDEVRRSRDVFDSIMAQRQTQSAGAIRMIADDPRLRTLLASDADRETIVDVTRTVYRAMGMDVLVLVDHGGALVVDMLAPDAWSGADMRADRLVVEALERGSAAGIWVDDTRAYEVQAQRMSLGARTLGVVVAGKAMGDALAALVQRQTGNALVVVLDRVPIAISPLAGITDLNAARALLGNRLDPVLPGAVEPVDVTLGDTRFLAVSGRFGTYRGTSDLRFVLLRNLDRALAPGERLTVILVVVLVLSVLSTIALALLGARFLTGPIDRLVAFTRRIALGDFQPMPPVAGFSEVQVLGEAMNRMAAQMDTSRRLMAEKDRLENELRIASQIQTSILPARVGLPGLAIAARMDPADEVGGDYYDVIPAADGGWIGIGDVAGHGLDAGLIMVMAQSGIAALVAADPDAPPSRVLGTLNRVLYDNVKTRLESNRHMTLSLVRYHQDGRLVVAGAHMDMLRLRARASACEHLATTGTWLALVDDIASVTVDATHHLEEGDLIVLYSDGLVEAANARGEQLGIERVDACVIEARDRPTADICERLFALAHGWGKTQEDDITVLVMRYGRDGT